MLRTLETCNLPTARRLRTVAVTGDTSEQMELLMTLNDKLFERAVSVGARAGIGTSFRWMRLMTPMDCLKRKVYMQRSQNVQELTQRIYAVFDEIHNDKDKLERAMHNITSRMLKSLLVNGEQLNAHGF
jgi:hypothetical protein